MRLLRCAQVSLLLLLAGGSVLCQEAAAPQIDLKHWKTVYDHMVLVRMTKDSTVADAEALGDALRSKGATNVIAVENEAVIASTSESSDGIASLRNVEQASSIALTAAQTVSWPSQARAAVAFFNAAKSGELLANLEAAATAPPMPQVPDAFSPPPLSVIRHRAADWSLPNRKAIPLTWQGRFASMGPGWIRTVLFFVESDGSVDPNLYTWTPAEVDNVTNNILQGYQFWTDIAPNYGKTFSFLVYTYSPIYSTVVNQAYEPITHPAENDSLWVAPVMAHLGYTQPSHFDRVRAFEDYLVSLGTASSAFVSFIAYNPAGAPGTFPAGQYGSPASYAYLGNWSQLTSNPFGLRGFLPAAAAHEMGHVYWACDEYGDSQHPCSCAVCDNPSNDSRPPFNTAPNANCETCGGNTNCVMQHNDRALSSRAICTYTAQHIGWPAMPCFVSNVSPYDWYAQYYNDAFNGFSWNHLVAATRGRSSDEGGSASGLAMSWGAGSPSIGPCVINADRFSASFESTIYYWDGVHAFTATADNGVRVFVDGTPVIDSWADQPLTTHTGAMNLTAGYHRVTVQYYQATGDATLNVSWN